MSFSFLLRSKDICETVVHLRCKAAALAASLTGDMVMGESLRAVDGRLRVVRGDFPPFVVVDVVDIGSDLSNFSTSSFFANNSS